LKGFAEPVPEAGKRRQDLLSNSGVFA
jgi:hypothetical protein